MRRRVIALVLSAAAVLSASEFQDGQAARAVIGQPSFSAVDKGASALSLSLVKGNLYLADTTGHVMTYDLSRIGSSQTPGCPVCLVQPQSTAAQSVFEGVAASAVNGRNIVISDAKSHRVMIWRGISRMQKPDVVLSGFANPVSVALDNQRLFVGDAGTHRVYIWNALPTSDGQQPDVTLGIAETADGPGAGTIQTPSALVSDGANLFVADAPLHRVLVFSPGDLEMPQVVNSATLMSGPVAPGTLVSLNHGSTTTSVFLNGSPLAPIQLSNDQMQLQIPNDLNSAAAGSLWIRTELKDGSYQTSRAVALRFTPASPGIFAFGTKEPRTGLLLHAPDGVPLSPENHAKPGELLTVWATGLGAVASEANSEGAFETLIPVRATLNGTALDVVSSALPADATGVYEVRLRLPSELPVEASLVLFQNDSKSNAVTFPTR